MKIILVLNKTLIRNGQNLLDAGYFNFYIPLLELGHEVLFYDTIKGSDKNFLEIVESFSPDLILSCLTGNPEVTPHEPISEIEQITKEGKIKTLNWFCDDTWRFDSFSKQFCKKFSHCTTPEKKYISKYKDIGYENIILGNWHCNNSLKLDCNKNIEVGFCGGLTESRSEIFNYLKSNNIPLTNFYGLSYEDVFRVYGSSKIVFNLTVNNNDPEKKAQMKLRIFEAVCSGSLLITEYVEDLQDFFELEEEIVTFKTKEEAINKIVYYLSNDKERESIAEKGHQRFLKDHTSKIRLEKLLNSFK
jgi:spore maturation protein CgeB